MYHLVKLLSMGSARDVLLTRVMADVTEHGIGDRSLRDLAASIGTSHRLLIYHFGSRAGLVDAVVAAVEAAQRATFADLAAGITDPTDLVRALWRSVSAPAVRSFVRLFFESLAYRGESSSDDLTGTWLDESERVAAELGIRFDPVGIRLGVAVIRGLLIDVIATGDVATAEASLERFLYGGFMSGAERDLSADESTVSALSDAYEAALVRNDLDAMNAVFWTSPEVVRFGVADMQVGYDDVVAWRATAQPVNPTRRTLSKSVLALAPGVVAVDITFRNGDDPTIGRQSQTWVRKPEGWRIVRAHVSTIVG